MTAAEARDERLWWGTFSLLEGELGYWQVGPSEVWVGRLSHEWQLHHQQGDDPEMERVVVEVPSADTASPEGIAVDRFTFANTGSSLEVQPRLADRAVVVRPVDPVYVMAGEVVTLFVSTPLWLRFAAGDPSTTLIELPSYRPSDTWFGASTREGELCYASRTAARVRLDDLPRPPHRAVTPVRIANLGGDHLLVERVRLPVEYLALYRSLGGRFWTQAATLKQEGKGELSELELGSGPPTEAGRATAIAEPRERAEQGLLLRAFSRLFSGEGRSNVET